MPGKRTACAATQATKLLYLRLYLSLGLVDRISDCLLTSTAAVNAEDVLVSFLFNTACGAIHDLPWCNIWSIEVLKQHWSLQVVRNAPTKVIRVSNKDNPWFSDHCRRAFDFKQEAHHRLTRDRSRVQRTNSTKSLSSPLTIGGTVLYESDYLDILKVTYDPNMNFEKHL